MSLKEFPIAATLYEQLSLARGALLTADVTVDCSGRGEPLAVSCALGGRGTLRWTVVLFWCARLVSLFTG